MFNYLARIYIDDVAELDVRFVMMNSMSTYVCVYAKIIESAINNLFSSCFLFQLSLH